MWNPPNLRKAWLRHDTTAAGAYQGVIIVPAIANTGIRLWAIELSTRLTAAIPGKTFCLLMNGNASEVIWAGSWAGIAGGISFQWPGGYVHKGANPDVVYRIASDINLVQTDIVVYYTYEAI